MEHDVLLAQGFANGFTAFGRWHDGLLKDKETGNRILPGTPQMAKFEDSIRDATFKVKRTSRQLFLLGALMALVGLVMSALGNLPL